LIDFHPNFELKVFIVLTNYFDSLMNLQYLTTRFKANNLVINYFYNLWIKLDPN